MLRVQALPFDPGAELNAFTARTEGAGAVVSFTGLVRGDGGIIAMEIEHYPGMTEAAIAEMMATATARFDLTDALVIHRFGPLQVGEPIMMVATAARHRVAAFQAAEFLMDYLKSRAPFWKKEGNGNWVEARDEDETALTRWR